jgi:hypothetical protein
MMMATMLSFSVISFCGSPASRNRIALTEKVLGRVIELEKDTTLAGQVYLTLAGIHRKLGKTVVGPFEIHPSCAPICSMRRCFHAKAH